jgi:hypothetical protein
MVFLFLTELIDGRWHLTGRTYRDPKAADDHGRAWCERAPAIRVYYVKPSADPGRASPLTDRMGWLAA